MKIIERFLKTERGPGSKGILVALALCLAGLPSLAPATASTAEPFNGPLPPLVPLFDALRTRMGATALLPALEPSTDIHEAVARFATSVGADSPYADPQWNALVDSLGSPQRLALHGLLDALTLRNQVARTILEPDGPESHADDDSRLVQAQILAVAYSEGFLRSMDSPAPVAATSEETDFVFDSCPLMRIDLRDDDGTTMCDYAFTYDHAGDDLYLGNAGGAGVALASAFAIDLTGDDVYNRQGSLVGGHAGGASSGLGGLIDVRGHDTYRSDGAAAATGSANLGSGLLFDLGGDDEYRATGAGATAGSIVVGGIGLHVDLAGDDVYVSDQVPAAHGAASAMTGFATLLDLSGDDTYEATSAGAANGASLPTFVYQDLRCGGCPLYRGFIQAGGGAMTGFLVDSAGNDWYEAQCSQATWANGAWGFLYDLEGRDTYIDGLREVRVDFQNGEQDGVEPACEPGVTDETFAPKPPGQSSGAQIDRSGPDEAWPAKENWLVLPSRPVSQAPGQACLPHLGTGFQCSADPVALTDDGLRCLGSITNPSTGAPCAAEPLPTGFDERDVSADAGQVFWLRDARVFAHNVLTQAVGPLGLHDGVDAFTARGSLLAFLSDGQLYLEDALTGERIELGSATEAPDFDGRFIVWADGDCIHVYDVASASERTPCVANGISPRVSAGHLAYIQGRPMVDSLVIASPLDLGLSANQIAIDGDFVAWTGQGPWGSPDGVWARRLNDPFGPTIHVAASYVPNGGLDVAGAFVVWSDIDPLTGLARVVGRDVSHLRYTDPSALCGMPDPNRPPESDNIGTGSALDMFPGCQEGPLWTAVNTYDDAVTTPDRTAVPLASAGGALTVISTAASTFEHALRPRASTHLVAWEQCAQMAGGACTSDADVYFAELLGPELVGLSLAGGIENCYNTATPEEGPATLMNSAVGAPDFNEDGMGDCWAAYFGQVIQSALDRLSDLDCDTLNNIEEYRWKVSPLYDVPFCYALDGYPHEVLFANGRDFDRDYLLDGFEARYIERATGGPRALLFSEAIDGVASADPATVQYAMYHPLWDHDFDGDGVRDMEDRNSDSAVTDANPSTDTIQDGIEIWVYDTFPDRGDSDCSPQALVCRGSREMVGEEPTYESSEDRGTGDGLTDSKEVHYWLNDDALGGLYLVETLVCTRLPGGAAERCTIVDDINNVLLDPDSDGDGFLDYDECVRASHRICTDPTFNPEIGPQDPSEGHGGPEEGGLASQQASSGPNLATVSCPSGMDPDSDGDGVLDGLEAERGLDPCNPATFGIPDLHSSLLSTWPVASAHGGAL